MKRLIALLLAFAGALFGASSAVASGPGYTSYTYPVSPGLVTESTAVLQSDVDCGGNPCSMIYRYRAVGAASWTLANGGDLVALCNAQGIGFGCGSGSVDYAINITGLAPATAYEYQVGLKLGTSELAWAGPDGTAGTTTSWTTDAKEG
jgi:hypothetical protein